MIIRKYTGLYKLYSIDTNTAISIGNHVIASTIDII